MEPHILANIIFFQIAFTKAALVPSVRDVDTVNQQHPTTSARAQTRWSRQDIFTLVSVCVAVVGIFIAVLVASPTLREWLYRPFHRKLELLSVKYNLSRLILLFAQDCAIRLRRRRARRQDEARRRLQERYEDYVRFREFLELMG